LRAALKVFDEFQSIGRERGIKSPTVYQAVENPNDVAVAAGGL
jgi:hypothetical protein